MRRAAALLCAGLMGTGAVCAQDVVVRHYDSSDGLGHNQVHAIFQDSRGFVWFATHDGLTRYDGYTFKTYGDRDGLPHAIVEALTETRDGRLLAAMFSGGLVQLAGDGSRFETIPVGTTTRSNQVGAAVVDAGDSVWCATDDALFRGTRGATGWLFTRVMPLPDRGSTGPSLLDSHGRIWMALEHGLLLVDDVRRRVWLPPESIVSTPIVGIAEAGGRMLVANTRQVFEWASDGTWSPVGVPTAPKEALAALLGDSTGRVWIGTSRRLFVWDRGGQPEAVTVPGLDSDASVLYEDRNGEIWVGTRSSGVFVIGAERPQSYGTASGLRNPSVRSIYEDSGGRIFITTDGGAAEVVGSRVLPIAGGVDGGARMVRDHGGVWWAGFDGTLYRIRASEPRMDRAEVVLRVPTGPPGEWNGPTPLVAPDGSVWVTTAGDSVYRIEHPERRRVDPRRTQIADGPVLAGRLAVDRDGDVWLSSYGQLRRLRPGAPTAQPVERGPGLPETLGRALLVDSRGWLWIGLRYQGVSFTRDPGADRPSFRNLSTATGLISDSVWAICEDHDGRMYFGTGRGLDRYDPRTQAIRHFTTRDGLIGTIVNGCTIDSRGRLWVATMQGLSRFEPPAEKPPAPLHIYFMRVRAGGEEHRIGERGATTLSGYELSAATDDLVVEFVTPAPGRPVNYEYRLSDAAAWTSIGTQRSLTLARLSPGNYRLLVRSIDGDGRTGDAAGLAFRVVPPVWQRWWFVGLAALALSGLGLAFHRARLRRMLAVERVRQQVALDLHDDIGSGLTQIAMLSEVARRNPSATAAALGETAQLARSLRESMSDIVWAIDPRKDTLSDLVQRMRQTAFSLLDANGIEVTFDAPAGPALTAVALTPDRRRHLFLLFKEAVTNALRHANARHIRLGVTADASHIALVVDDDGEGFTMGEREGHGLQGMRARADAMHGTLTIVSRPAVGTTVRVTVPCAGPRTYMRVSRTGPRH